jgi:hypothetical protein
LLIEKDSWAVSHNAWVKWGEGRKKELLISSYFFELIWDSTDFGFDSISTCRVHLELKVPGIDKNTSPTCILTFLYVKLGVMEGGQFISTAARIVLLSPMSGMIRMLSGGVLPAGFMHDAVRSACKNGLILAIFSIPAILIVQLRSFDV